MTNISYRRLTSQEYRSIETELLTLLSKLTESSANYFVTELLTESERVMITKRFGVILMCSQHYSAYRIAETLGLSQPTVARLVEQYATGQYKNLIKPIPKKEMDVFLEFIANLINAQVSPRSRARLMNSALYR